MYIRRRWTPDQRPLRPEHHGIEWAIGTASKCIRHMSVKDDIRGSAACSVILGRPEWSARIRGCPRLARVGPSLQLFGKSGIKVSEYGILTVSAGSEAERGGHRVPGGGVQIAARL